MKKSSIILSFLFTFGAFQLFIQIFFSRSIINPNSSSWGIIISMLVYIVLSILGLYFRLEEKQISNKEVSLIAIYSAFTAVSRVPFLAVPSLQPCTFLIICAGYVFGPLIGFIIGVNTALLSNFLVGQGPWTIYQMFAWGITGLLGGFLGMWIERRNKKKSKKTQMPSPDNWETENEPPKNEIAPSKIINRWILGLLGIILGITYGVIMNLWSWLAWIPVRTWQSWLLYYTSSLPYDLIHAIGNGLFLYFFGKRTIHILLRYRERFLVTNFEVNRIKAEI